MSPAEPYASRTWPTAITALDAKRALAATAVDMVRDELAAAATAAPRLGVGSGSTSYLTLMALAEMRADLPGDLAVVASSYEMAWYATAAGFPVVDLDGDGVVVAFDGADQVDPSGALIKGRGGAMRRERAVLSAARRALIVVDASKQVEVLGGGPLPLELRPTGIFETVNALETVAGAPVVLRSGSGKDGPVLTESGFVLADLLVPAGLAIDSEFDARIRDVPGVGETGYFAPSARRTLITG